MKNSFYIFALALYFGLGLSCNGQIYNRNKPHLIEFSNSEEPSFRELRFKIVEIIDKTGVKDDTYGYVFKGFNKTLRPIKFKGGVEKQFRIVIDNYSFHNPLGMNLKMEINTLGLSQAPEAKSKKKNPGIIILGIRYLFEDEVYLQESFTKTLRKVVIKQVFMKEISNRCWSKVLKTLKNK